MRLAPFIATVMAWNFVITFAFAPLVGSWPCWIYAAVSGLLAGEAAARLRSRAFTTGSLPRGTRG